MEREERPSREDGIDELSPVSACTECKEDDDPAPPQFYLRASSE